MDSKKLRILSGSHLKWLALTTMIIDHTAMVFVDRYEQAQLYSMMRGIGRLAFPIFCFLLVEGFYHTHNLMKYAATLGIFALISEIFYNFVVGGMLAYPAKQNVFFTLFLGIIMMKLMKLKQDDVAWRLIFLMAACGISELFNLDYGMFGMMQIAALYFCHENHLIRSVVLAALNFCQGGLQAYGALAAILVVCYNEKRGKQWKYFFYAVYPLHLLILYLIRENI